MEQIRKWLRHLRQSRFKYKPLIKVYVDSKRILDNLTYFEKNTNLMVSPVLKSNAYGHGLIEVAKILKNRGNIPFFSIDTYSEALILENEGIKKQKLILGFTQTENILRNSLHTTSFTIGQIEQLLILQKEAKNKIKIHLKIDTGMNRQGIPVEDIKKALEAISGNPFIQLDGICSHIASPHDLRAVSVQKRRWESALHEAKKHFQKIPFLHILATQGSHLVSEFESNVARIGIGLFGIDPSGKNSKFISPALSVETCIAAIKDVQPGEQIGYDGSFVASTHKKIAVLPFGYYEGLDRRLSNVGSVKIAGNLASILGKISMNICVVDVSHIPDVSYEDAAQIISSNPQDANSVAEMAKLCGTIPYEVLIHLPAHLRRVVF